VIVEGDDIHGEGVNIAARLEGLAEPGGICLSSDAYRQAKGRIEAEFEDMGEQALKNVAEPVRVYRIAGDSSGTASAAPAKAPLALPDKPSIAVLPFTNMSGDPEQEYFADGMVEEITAALSRVRSFFVIAWSSAFAYRNKTTNVREIAKELSVRYLLEGSVRRSGDRVRIMAELLQGDDGHQIWAGKYEGTMDDVFEFQDSITSAIVGVIQPTIREAEIRRSRRKPPSNLQAYDYVM
jgi:adenylate cyclase